MARTAIVPVVLNGIEGIAAIGAGTAVDQANGMSVEMGEKPAGLVLIIQNDEAGLLEAYLPDADGTGNVVTIDIAGSSAQGVIGVLPGQSGEIASTGHTLHVDFEATFTGVVWAYQLLRH